MLFSSYRHSSQDPFGKGLKPVKGLQVYEEHQNHSTTHWFVARPMLQCKNATFDEPNLCSGSTVGTRPAMLKYLDIMFEEIKDWIKTPNCTFSDQVNMVFRTISPTLVDFLLVLTLFCSPFHDIQKTNRASTTTSTTPRSYLSLHRLRTRLVASSTPFSTQRDPLWRTMWRKCWSCTAMLFRRSRKRCEWQKVRTYYHVVLLKT